MNSNIRSAIDEIVDRARIRYDELLKGARQGTEQAARGISKGKAPLQTVTKLGLGLTGIGHKTADKALKHNKKFISNRLDSMAFRLRSAAGARDIKELLSTQLNLIPDNTAAIVDETRDALGIVAAAGGEVRDLVLGTVNELRGKKAPTGKSRAPRKAAPAAKPASRKKKKVVKKKAGASNAPAKAA